MARTGRPPKEINQDIFENLCGLQCTEEEVCQVLGCDKNTLNKFCRATYKATFSQVFAQKRGIGKISLRRAQWRCAEKGNAAMLIWLGKQYLGQSDKAEIAAVSEREIEKDPLSIAFEKYINE